MGPRLKAGERRAAPHRMRPAAKPASIRRPGLVKLKQVGALLLAALVVLTVAFPPSSGAAPWSIERIAARGLTPEALVRALPSGLGALVLEATEIPGFTISRPCAFATESRNHAHSDPIDPQALPAIVVNASTLCVGI